MIIQGTGATNRFNEMVQVEHLHRVDQHVPAPNKVTTKNHHREVSCNNMHEIVPGPPPRQ